MNKAKTRFSLIFKKLLNYIGQMRLYSLLDFVVFSTALTQQPSTILAMVSLWCSYILYLEYVHKDALRLPINFFIPLTLFLFAFIFLPFWVPCLFALFSFLYTKKKQNKFFGVTASIWRACINAVFTIALRPSLLLPTVIIIFTRNLIADFRDAEYDKKNGTVTIPVLLGCRKNYKWAFYFHPICMMISTIVWSYYSFIDIHYIILILVTQILVYPLTPRASTPKHLNLYH